MRRPSHDDPLAGVDSQVFDTRIFEPGMDQIEAVCRFFELGKIRGYGKDTDLGVSHSNFLYVLNTAKGRYALKFYPQKAETAIVTEQTVNRILMENGFSTPLMLAGRNRQAWVPAHGRLAVCYAYVDGRPAWEHIREKETIGLINRALLAIKDILSVNAHRLPASVKAKPLGTTIEELAGRARTLGKGPGKDIVNASLLDACKTYQEHRSLFIPRWLHNNAGLNNFLIQGTRLFTLDLCHICPDYDFCDLGSMIISCLFFDVPAKIMDAAAGDYFAGHGISSLIPKPPRRWHQFPVLNTLVKVGLVKEYLKNARRQESLAAASEAKDLKAAYGAQLLKRQKVITSALKKLALARHGIAK